MLQVKQNLAGHITSHYFPHWIQYHLITSHWIPSYSISLHPIPLQISESHLIPSFCPGGNACYENLTPFMMLVPKCGYPFSAHQRRRIKTEEKVKVVASVWGGRIIQFLSALAVLPRTFLKNGMNSSFSFKQSWCNSSYYSNRPRKNSQCAKELNNLSSFVLT